MKKQGETQSNNEGDPSKNNIRPRRDCPPIGNGLAVGMLSSRRDVGLSNAF